MGAFHLALAVSFLLSSPARAQWWSFIWANPKASTSSSPSSIPPAVTSQSITSMSDTPGATDWLVTENGVAEKALQANTQTEGSVLTPTPSPGVSVFRHSTAEPGTLRPEANTGGHSKARAQYKPLKHWKGGEFFGIVKEGSIIVAFSAAFPALIEQAKVRPVVPNHFCL